MGARSKVVKLPADIKQWLDQVLVAQSFGGYEALAAELAARGYGVSKSSLHRYGSAFEERLGAMKFATEQAKAIAVELGDEEGALNDAALRVIQERLFTAAMNSDDLSHEMLAKLADSTARVARASVDQKQWAAKLKKEQQKHLDSLEKEARDPKKRGKTGLDLETIKRIRLEVYGVRS